MHFFTDLIGQEQAVEFLEGAIRFQRLAPAYLFVGPSGIGRRLAAKSFALSILMQKQSLSQLEVIRERVVAQNHPDLLVVEPTYQHQGKFFTAAQLVETGVKRKTLPLIRLEQIRQICQFITRAPLESTHSIVIIEDVHLMNESAANGLLKTLEEPVHGIFILIAKSLQSILPTLISRCQYIPFSRLSRSDMLNVLQSSGHGEILLYEDILTLAQGSPGEAIDSYAQYQAISIDLRMRLVDLPQGALEALKLAQVIDSELELEKQLWLVSYLQQKYWQKYRNRKIIESLEFVRRYLTNYVQPRLVWEDFYLRNQL